MADFIGSLARYLRSSDLSGRPFADTLAAGLEKLGHNVLRTTAGEDPVIVVENGRRRIIRCKYYPDSFTSDYMAALSRAILNGKVGRGYLITVDQATQQQRAYTIHVVIGRFDK